MINWIKKLLRIKPEKYYFPVIGWDNSICIHFCGVKRDNTKIGSATCQECEYFLDSDSRADKYPYIGPTWISCKKLKKAKKGRIDK